MSEPTATREQEQSKIAQATREPMSRSGQQADLVTVGIDLGTTHSSVVALDRNQAPYLLPLAPPQHTIPTVVYLPEEEPHPESYPPEIVWDRESQFPPCLIGEEAQARLLQSPDRGALLFKRRMGETSWYVEIDQHRYTAETLAILFLYQLRKRSLLHLTGPISGAVVTVPAYFPDAARRSTSQAAEAAGWPLLGLLNEPTAAALAHGYQYRAPSLALDPAQSRATTPAHGERILVFDLGGGTLDLSVLVATDEQLQVLASCGDPALGCQDWDDAIAQHVADAFFHQFHWNPLEHPESFEALRRICRDTRERLSQQSSATLHYEQHGCLFTQTWTQSQLRDRCSELLDRCKALLTRTLAESETQISQIKRVLLAGGGSRMPMIIHMLAQIFDVVPNTSLDPARAVATGAALFAAQLQQYPAGQQRSDADRFLPGQTIQEVTPYPLGLLYLREKRLHYRPLFARHTPLPAQVTIEDFTTFHDQQTTLDLLLSQSSDTSMQPDTLTAACRLSGLPALPAGNARICVTFSYNTQSMIEISATEQHTQTPLTTTMLSPQALMEQMQASVSRHIVILVDTSASMAGRPLVEAKYAIIRFLEVLEEQQEKSVQKVGLLSFGDQGVRVLSEPRHDFVYLRGLVAQLTSGGKTPMAEGLNQALLLLQQIPPEEEVQEKLVIVLSDGLPNAPEQASAAAAQLHHADIRVIAIGLGADVDADFLSAHICSSPEEYRSVTDPIELPVSFASLAMELRWSP